MKSTAAIRSLLAALAFVTCIGGCGQSPTSEELARLREEIAGIREVLDDVRTDLQAANDAEPSTGSQARQAIEQRLTQMERQLDQLTAVLHRAVGDHIPIRLPEDLQQEIVQLEACVTTPEKWPGSFDEAEQLDSRLRTLVDQIPPWAEEELLPRLVALRWSTEGFWLRYRIENVASANADEQPARLDAFEPFVSRLRDLVDNAPTNAPPELVEELSREVETNEAKFVEAQREHALTRAKKALDGQADPADAWSLLEPFASEEEISDLRSRLRTKVLEMAFEDRLTEAREMLEQAGGLAAKPRVRQATILRAYESAISVLLDLHKEQDRFGSLKASTEKLVADCERQIDRLRSEQEEQSDSSRRAYQSWALQQIRACRETWNYDQTRERVDGDLRACKQAKNPKDWELFRLFPSTKSLLAEELKVDLNDVKGSVLTAEQQQTLYAAYDKHWTEATPKAIAYRVRRDAMVRFLLPIHVALLDPPVAQLYNKAYQEAWGQLEEEDQLFVAEQSAQVRKRGLDDD